MEVVDEILAVLDDIRQKNLLVIVEGKKDAESLYEVGIANVLQLKKPLFAVVEEIASKTKEVVLLTDLDDEGKKLYHELARDLQKNGVKVDNRLRELLFKTPLRHVEGLSGFLARAQLVR
ncbi:MAG: toprim domain-containing protein [Candidatus Woesearchaeota archaeon]